MKLLKKIVTGVLSASLMTTIVAGAASCGDNGASSTPEYEVYYEVYSAEQTLVFDNDTKSMDVEYGSVFNIPMNFYVDYAQIPLEETKVTLKDPNGEEQKLFYGSYRFNRCVGAYTLEYKSAEEVFTVTVNCKDTVAPVVRIVSYEYYGVLGDTITVPTAETSDLSGIKSLVYTVKAPSGAVKTIEGGSFVLEEAGSHVVTLTATDNNGVSNSASITVESMNTWVDEDLKTGEIYTFDNETYVDLVLGMESKYTTSSYSIVTEGYPEIENEKEGNGVLKIEGGDTWGDVNSLFFLHEDVLASTGYEIVVKYAVSDYVDYFKLFRNVDELTDQYLVDYEWEVQPGKWYELRINPIAFGYGMNFKDFVIQYRNRGGVDVYIDEIYFTQPEFEDEDWSATNYGDFDEEGYLHHVYQNVYNEPTTTRAYRVGGTKFEILPVGNEGVPAANAADKYYPNLAPTGSVLKGTTAEEWGGMTYMFPEAFDLNKGSYLRMRLYLEGTINRLVFGALDGKGFDSTNTAWYAGGTSYFHENQWVDYILPAEALKKYSTDDKISGIFFQFGARGGVNATHEMTFYVDEIEAVYKEGESEQKDLTIANFENGNLYNVTNNDQKASATYAIVEDALGTTGNSLEISATTSGNGFTYVLDTPIESDDDLKVKDITFKVGLPANAKTTSVSVRAVSTLTAKIDLGTYDLTTKNGWTQIKLNGLNVREVMGGKAILGFFFVFQTANGETIYFDDFGLIDYSNDVSAPTTTTETLSVYTRADLPVYLNDLDVEVTDDTDEKAYYTVVGFRDASGNDLSAEYDEETFEFQPTETANYVLAVALKDRVGNVSETIDIDVTIEVLEKNAFYTRAYNFDGASATAIVDNAKKASVKDADATDGYAVSALLRHDNSGKSHITVDLGSQYQVKELTKIVVRYKVVSAGTTQTWWRVMVNGDKTYGGDSLKGISATFSSECGANPTIGTQTMTSYGTMTITREAILTYLEGIEGGDMDTVLNTLVFWTQYRNSSAAYTQFYIDSIAFEEYVPYNEAWQNFDTAESLQAVSSSGGIKPTFVDDEQTASGKAVQFTLQNTGGGVNVSNNITINLGSKYKVKEIGSIVVTYKIVETGTQDQWWRVAVNGFDYYDSKPDATGGEYTMISGIQYSAECGVNPTQGKNVMTAYGTMTVSRESILAYLTATGTGDENTVVNDIRFWAQYQAADTRYTVWNIDSVAVKEYEEPVFDYTYLDFNTDAAASLVTTHYGDPAKIVTEADGTTKAVEFSFYGGANNRSASINLGDRKVSEIESITIRFKFTAGNNDVWPRIYLGTSTANAASSTYIVKNGFTNLKVGELKNDYVSITWTASALESYFGSTDAVVSALTFIDESWRDDTGFVCTVHVDSIQIALKAA